MFSVDSSQLIYIISDYTSAIKEPTWEEHSQNINFCFKVIDFGLEGAAAGLAQRCS